MRELFKGAMQMVFARMGYQINRRELINVLFSQYEVGRISEWLSFGSSDNLPKYVLENFGLSRAQLQQDLVAQWNLSSNEKDRKTPYFVEFGATDGLTLSNTYLLEQEFGWDGLLCEPGKRWHSKLARNRSCKIDQRCVYSTSGMSIPFTEVFPAELSTISSFAENDSWGEARKNSKQYIVETVSLEELLLENDAPKKIDYLSVDTEGSEYEILKNFNFDNWEIDFISVEHNFTEKREEIYRLLSSFCYSRKFTSISKWDDWYFRSN
jgi:FkbM family methyltransferase